MNIYIRSHRQTGLPETEIEYTAFQGFRALGFSPEFFEREEQLEKTRPDELVVGGVSIVTRKLQSFGIEVPNIDYPEELTPFLGRKIWKSTLEAVLSDPRGWPVFVKPIQEKAFTGFILKDEKSIPRLYRAKKEEPVYCSELVDFEAEWRVFVRYGNILDARPYQGDWHLHFDAGIIEQAVRDYHSAPAGYAIDFGVTADGETLLIEINDGFALGTYGLDPIQYAKLLSARWCEFTNIHDECDQYLERVDWKNRKRG